MYNFFPTYKVFLIFVIPISHNLMKRYTGLFITSLTLLISPFLYGQQKSSRLEEADRLHNRYEFEEAIKLYNSVLGEVTDSLQRLAIERKLILSENGVSLLEYADNPVVVGRRVVAKELFFLNCPGFEEGSWMETPLKWLNGEQRGQWGYFYYPTEAGTLYYSAPDEKGSWNIYRIERLNDTLWSAPVVMNENITSIGNELFPMVSRDGKTLYFSSNGHYGVGGYDLYSSKWNEETADWEVPQNMGFPYSSPKNDLLFYNTSDGNFSLFASDRESSGDSLLVYALLYENMPLKKRVTPAEAAELAKLNIRRQDGEERGSEASKERENVDNEKYREYRAAIEWVKSVERRLDETLKQQKLSRELYNTLKNPDDLAALEKRIGELELEVITLQEEEVSASAKLQRVEMDFLSQGIFLKEPVIENGEKKGSNSSLPTFAFASNHLGTLPYMVVMDPVKPVDLSFRIEKEPQELMSMEEFPKGLVYQIQLYTLVKPVSGIKLLKGLTPVFERKVSGRYSYSAGAFPTYNEALSNLNRVKRLGFTSAIIKAYNNGEVLNTAQARALEKKIAGERYYRVVIEGYEVLPQELLTVVRSNSNKDIAKVSDGGRTKFLIGPFGSRDEAEMVMTALNALSDQTITVENIK